MAKRNNQLYPEYYIQDTDGGTGDIFPWRNIVKIEQYEKGAFTDVQNKELFPFRVMTIDGRQFTIASKYSDWRYLVGDLTAEYEELEPVVPDAKEQTKKEDSESAVEPKEEDPESTEPKEEDPESAAEPKEEQQSKEEEEEEMPPPQITRQMSSMS